MEFLKENPSAIMGAAGGMVQTIGHGRAGMAENSMARYESAQHESLAVAELATASHASAEEQRQKRLALSRAQLVGAASGGGRAANVEGAIEAEGQYRALTALWQGGEAASGRRTQAAVRRMEGTAARKAGFIRGFGTLAASGASMWGKYSEWSES